MTETNPEKGNPALKLPDERNGYTGIIGCARTGRNDDFIGSSPDNLFNAYFIVSENVNRGTGFSDILDKVIGKRIIIVYDENHAEPPVYC
jgi:hypothetical protein